MSTPHDNEDDGIPTPAHPHLPATSSYFQPQELNTVFVTRQAHEQPSAEDDLHALNAAEAKLAGRSLREQRRAMKSGFSSWVKRRGPMTLLVAVVCYFLWATYFR